MCVVACRMPHKEERQIELKKRNMRLIAQRLPSTCVDRQKYVHLFVGDHFSEKDLVSAQTTTKKANKKNICVDILEFAFIV